MAAFKVVIVHVSIEVGESFENAWTLDLIICYELLFRSLYLQVWVKRRLLIINFPVSSFHDKDRILHMLYSHRRLSRELPCCADYLAVSPDLSARGFMTRKMGSSASKGVSGEVKDFSGILSYYQDGVRFVCCINRYISWFCYGALFLMYRIW